MKGTALLGLAIATSTLTSAAQAQNVMVNQQQFGICAGAPISFSAWMALTAGQACNSSGVGNLGSVTVDWSFNNGPVDLDGLYFTGNGTFFLDIMDGDNVIQTTSFSNTGTKWIEVNASQVSRVRIRRESGVGAFGIRDIPVITKPNGNGPDGNGPPGNGPSGNGPSGNGPSGNGPSGNGPPGIGPQGNGPPGNGPNANGPPGNGPNGNGPPGNGPNGNGPPGPPNNNGATNTIDTDDALNDLVNQTNATPEPATLLLVASGLGGVGVLARRRRRNTLKHRDA